MASPITTYDGTVAVITGGASGVVCDVTDPASVDALADAAYDTFGKVNLLFNNAGVGAPSAKAWETTPTTTPGCSA